MPKIPQTYFSSSEPDFNTSALVEILSSVPNSPLTPGGILQTFTPTFPNASFSSNIGSRAHDYANLTPANLHYHALQQARSSNNSVGLTSNGMQAYTNVSPRSLNANTSGYLSQMDGLNVSGSSHSSGQLNGHTMGNFQQHENQMVLVNSSGNISRHLNENDSHSYEKDNNPLTPIYNLVSRFRTIDTKSSTKTFKFISLGQQILTENASMA